MMLSTSRSLILPMILAVLYAIPCRFVQATQSTNASLPASYLPVAYQIGNKSAIERFKSYSGGLLTLNISDPVLTFDYGADVAGFPFVEVMSLSASSAQIELKYSEPFDGLGLAYGDGPWLFTNGLMNSFRTETFNITNIGRVESFFLQGGQRWQSITLLTNTSLTIGSVGFRPSVDIQPSASLIGAFSASKGDYDAIWDLGARAVQAACVEAYSQPSTWEITSEGALVRGQYPAQSAKGQGLGNYTMSFCTKIVRGGTGWRVAAGSNSGYGPYFVVTSTESQLINTNRTIVPANTLIAGFGFSIINESILSSAPVQYFSLPLIISEDEWYDITTNINSTGYNILINRTQVAFVPSAQYQQYISPSWGTNAVTDGTWGFGPFLDQSAYFKDVKVTAQNGSVVYTNALITQDVLEEYGIAANSRAVCLDGAKRDRVIWIGDFVHTSRELAASTGRFDFIQSMMELEFDWQFLSGPGVGLVPIQAFMGTSYQYRDVYYPSDYSETDYQLFFLVTLGDYFILTSDTVLLSKYWNGTKLLVETMVNTYLDPVTGLMAGEEAQWFTAQGAQNATAPTALLAVGLQQLIHLANALDDYATAKSYTSLLAKLSSSINTQLWSDDLGAYGLSLTESQDTSLLATAYTIRAGIANSSQATSSIEKVSDLFYLIGYKDSSTVANGGGTQLSPNVQGFLLESLFLAHKQLNVSADTVLPVIKNLLNTYWPKMVNQDEYYTGAPWEYMYPDGSPGIGIFTSLSHPWGGAPTYVLSDYVLGVRRELNETMGTYEWVFDPAWDIVKGLGLTWAKGRVPLFGGGWIEAEWSMSNGTTPSMTVEVKGTQSWHVTVIDPSPDR